MRVKTMDIRDVVGTIVALGIGVVLMCSFLIPLALDQIAALPEGANGESWGTLLKLVITISIVGLIAVAAYGFLQRGGSSK